MSCGVHNQVSKVDRSVLFSQHQMMTIHILTIIIMILQVYSVVTALQHLSMTTTKTTPSSTRIPQQNYATSITATPTITIVDRDDGDERNVAIPPSSNPEFLSNRRNLITSSSKSFFFATTTAVFGSILSSEIPVAHAAYGDSSNIALPSYIDFLIEKNQRSDTTAFLYQGADRDVQLQRIVTAITKIQTIPTIVESKKWSQVQGVITGPLGTLISTMNQIAGTKNKEAQKIIVKVKSDLFSIGQCATNKNEAACLAATATTVQDVNDFVKVAF